MNQQEYAGYNTDSAVPSSYGAQPRIVLDEYNSDLNFVIEHDGVTASSLHKDGFEYMWAGARATHGIRTGKVCFEVHVLGKLPVTMPETETNPYVMRVGWSVDNSNLQVGEDTLSYGYGSTGKGCVNNTFSDYGEAYSTGDTICCCIDLDGDPRVVLFTKNGRYLGVAFHLDAESNGQTFFPHVTVKNMRLAINFGQLEPYSPPLQGFSLISRVPPQNLERGSIGPASRHDCEVIMMVGLPGVGKTVWATKYANDHPEKKYCILGTNNIMDKMKVMGLRRERNYHGRWDSLIKQATDILNKMLEIAEGRNRNYILDQTNVYFSARRRKMSNFRGYRRIAAVLVTTDEVLKERTARTGKEEGKIVPVTAVLEMKANFVLPEVGEIFDDLWFIEEDRAASERLVAEFQREGKEYKENEKKSGSQSFVDKRLRSYHPVPSMSFRGSSRGHHHGGFQGNYRTRGAHGASNVPFHGPPKGAHWAPGRSYNDHKPPQGNRRQGQPYGKYNTGPQKGHNERPDKAYGTYDSRPPVRYNDLRPSQRFERGSEPYGTYDWGPRKRYDDDGPSYRQQGSYSHNNVHSIDNSRRQPPGSGKRSYCTVKLHPQMNSNMGNTTTAKVPHTRTRKNKVITQGEYREGKHHRVEDVSSTDMEEGIRRINICD